MPNLTVEVRPHPALRTAPELPELEAVPLLDDVPEDEVPEDEVPEDEVPEDEVPEDEVPEDEVPEEVAPEVEGPDDEVPEDEVPEEVVPEDEGPDDEAPEDDVPDDEAPLLDPEFVGTGPSGRQQGTSTIDATTKTHRRQRLGNELISP